MDSRHASLPPCHGVRSGVRRCLTQTKSIFHTSDALVVGSQQIGRHSKRLSQVAPLPEALEGHHSRCTCDIERVLGPEGGDLDNVTAHLNHIGRHARELVAHHQRRRLRISHLGVLPAPRSSLHGIHVYSLALQLLHRLLRTPKVPGLDPLNGTEACLGELLVGGVGSDATSDHLCGPRCLGRAEDRTHIVDAANVVEQDVQRRLHRPPRLPLLPRGVRVADPVRQHGLVLPVQHVHVLRDPAALHTR
mmetsp:Transcript_39988/g.78317  ORF Transcript_39988/g.78317 Transcript_39988/m.78317 type:complete len:248 (-) Transcript_39988:1113-1856(-)